MGYWVTALISSFALAAIIGPLIIRYLKKLKFGQKILEIGPKWHMSKQYTPTMGGFIFIIPVVLSTVVFGFLSASADEYVHVIMLVFALAFGGIGFIDDFTKIKKSKNQGLTALQKLLLQIAVAAAFVALMRVYGSVTTELYIPFFNVSYTLPWHFYAPLAIFVIVGTVNSVNLTDGVDGLAAGVTVPVSAFFLLVFLSQNAHPGAAFAAALIGGLIGFLIYNFNPAKVFMGDTGSLFLGGAVCAMAFGINMPLILVTVGLIYIVETLSDIIQILYFKMSGGKRFFKMAPLHHHLEMSGWGEKKIVFVFFGMCLLMCIVSYLAVIPNQNIPS